MVITYINFFCIIVVGGHSSYGGMRSLEVLDGWLVGWLLYCMIGVFVFFWFVERTQNNTCSMSKLSGRSRRARQLFTLQIIMISEK